MNKLIVFFVPSITIPSRFLEFTSPDQKKRQLLYAASNPMPAVFLFLSTNTISPWPGYETQDCSRLNLIANRLLTKILIPTIINSESPITMVQNKSLTILIVFCPFLVNRTNTFSTLEPITNSITIWVPNPACTPKSLEQFFVYGLPLLRGYR